MLKEAQKGNTFIGKVWKAGTSLVITVSPPVQDYLEVKEGDKVAMVCEHSPKHGKYMGVGKMDESEEEKQ